MEPEFITYQKFDDPAPAKALGNHEIEYLAGLK